MSKLAPKEFIDWLGQEIKKRGWSLRDTARAAGISHTPISYALNGELPSFDTCIALADAFSVSRELVLRMAGYLPKPPNYTPTIEEGLSLLESLSEDDRQEILAAMRFKVEHKKRQEQGKKKA
jgi:transcriptional regulator with XRE-family HTH domain